MSTGSSVSAVVKRYPPRDPLLWICWGVFVIAVTVVPFLMAQRPVSEVPLPVKKAVPVPAGDIPMYHVIAQADVITTVIVASQIPTDTLFAQRDLVGHYTRETL